MNLSVNPTMAELDLDAAVVVALGANLSGVWGSPVQALDQALHCMKTLGLSVVARSSWWRSAAWPDPSQPDYVNAVALVDTTLDATGVLAALHRIEQAFGRERGERNAARVLDLDLIAHGRTVMSTSTLTLPHPRAARRLFVMGPLAEIAPDWRLPVGHVTVRMLAAQASVGRDAAPLARTGAGG